MYLQNVGRCTQVNGEEEAGRPVRAVVSIVVSGADIDETDPLEWERTRPRWALQTMRASEAIGGVVSAGG